MRIVVDIVNGMVNSISADQPIPDDFEVIIMTDNLTNAKPDEIGRADGRNALVYGHGVDEIDDRRYWRDIEDSKRKSDLAYARAYGEYDSGDVIEGEAREVKGPVGLLREQGKFPPHRARDFAWRLMHTDQSELQPESISNIVRLDTSK